MKKTGLEFNIKEMKIMASDSITSCQIDGKKVETGTDFFFGSKVTVGGECNHKAQRHLLAPWKKRNDKLMQHIKKQRHYFAKKVYRVKTMVFALVVYGCESWNLKKAEC